MTVKTKNLLGAAMLISVLAISNTACSSYSPRAMARDAAHTKPVKQRQSVVRIATSLIGTPYRFGGTSPKTGFDCSGLVFYTHQQLGHTLPRTASALYKATKPISKRSLQPGDLVFFRIHRRKISHVGIYLGNNKFVHAPSSGKVVSVTSLNNPYWKKRFIRGGRVNF